MTTKAILRRDIRAAKMVKRFRRDLHAGRPITPRRLRRLTALDPKAGSFATRIMNLLCA